MNTRSILAAGWIAMVLASSARGQFAPGHVFVAESAGKNCMQQDIYGPDRIWEINPETGEVSLFVQIPPEMCGFLTGLAFTPDGTRLRASSSMQSWILEFDSEGNITIALDSSDGIVGPWGFNNLAFDAEGNFYVVNSNRKILRFPSDGGAPIVFADESDGMGFSGGAIAISADGDLYFGNHLGAFNNVLRFTGVHQGSVFDAFEWNVDAVTITADDDGHVYFGLDSAEILRYDAGDPESREVLAVLSCPIRCSMAMSPDQTTIYLHRDRTLFGIDVVDGTVTTLAVIPPDMFLGWGAGIAVVPTPPPPIPTISRWGLIMMTLLVLTVGTIMIQRYRRVIV